MQVAKTAGDLRERSDGAKSLAMTRFRRPFHDDLAEVFIDAISTGAGAIASRAANSAEVERARAEREAQRERIREERRARRQAEEWRQLFGWGGGLLVGGMVSTLGVPVVVAVGAGLLTGGVFYFGVKQLQRQRAEAPANEPPRVGRRILPPEVDASGLAKARKDLIQGVLDDAAEQLKKLQTVSRSIASSDPEAAALCARLISGGERLSDAVAEEPGKFEIAKSMLTYHLGKAAYVAETFLVSEQAARRLEARHVLGRMDMLLEKTLLDLKEVNAAEMDLELRLINQTLDEELGGPIKPQRN